MNNFTASALPNRLYRADQVRELDRIAIEEYGLPGALLMARAGASAFATLQARWPDARRVGVLCGLGNNAGDGFVLARLALEAGYEVRVLQVGDINHLRGEALHAWRQLSNADGMMHAFDAGYLAGLDVIVDALLGNGLDREVTDEWRVAIEAINLSPAPVLAIDIPSGLHADSGRVLGCAVKADVCVSFIGLKQGMFTAAGPDHCSVILFDDLSIPPAVFTKINPSAVRLTLDSAPQLPSRARSAQKGDFGQVLVIGGDAGMAGAVRLAAEAALRVGAGLVNIATRGAHAPNIAAQRPELLCHGVDDVAEIARLLRAASVVAIGPGLGQSSWGKQLLAAALETSLPLVVDADALNLLAAKPKTCADWVLTPHPGEAGRLLACDTKVIQDDRFHAVEELQRRYGGVIVLKGAGTLVCSAGEPIAVSSAGNPGMASGGMGDLLTGVIAGLIAQGLAPGGAARLGVALHAEAGDRAALEGQRGMVASDLLAHLRRLVNPP